MRDPERKLAKSVTKSNEIHKMNGNGNIVFNKTLDQFVIRIWLMTQN